MTNLYDIPGIDPDAVPLLQLAGLEVPSDLVAIPAKTVRKALEGVQGGQEGLPSEATIIGWQEAVRTAAFASGVGRGFQAGRQMPVAQPLSGQDLVAAGISAAAVPVARILGEAGGREGGLWNAERRSPVGGGDRKSPEATLPAERPRRKVVRELAPPEEPEEERQVEAMVFPSTEERSRAETDFERKNRGMTHKNPWSVVGSALATLLANMLTLMGVGTIIAAILLEYVFKHPVPSQLAFGLLTFPLALVVFLMWGCAARCRLCGQRLFMPRQCRKHERAHHSILGYVTTLALHVVVFRWFRCSMCGTKQKLR